MSEQAEREVWERKPTRRVPRFVADRRSLAPYRTLAIHRQLSVMHPDAAYGYFAACMDVLGDHIDRLEARIEELETGKPVPEPEPEAADTPKGYRHMTAAERETYRARKANETMALQAIEAANPSSEELDFFAQKRLEREKVAAEKKLQRENALRQEPA